MSIIRQEIEQNKMDSRVNIFGSKGVYILILSIISIEVYFLFEISTIGNAIFAFGCALLIVLYMINNKWRLIVRKNAIIEFMPAFAALSAYAISTFWSADRIETIIQSILFAIIIIASLLFSTCNSSILIRAILKVGFYAAILSILLALALPEVGLQKHWSTAFPEMRGIFRHQQRSGLFFCIVFGLAVIAKLNAWPGIFDKGILKKFWIFIAVIVIAIIFSFARAYTASMLVALILSFIISKKVTLKLALLFAGLTITSMTLYIISEPNFTQHFYSVNFDEITLTGRTMVWERTIRVANEQYLLGHGFGVFASPNFDYIWGKYRAPHAHNSYLQSYFDLGVIGLILITILVYSHLKTGLSSNKYGYTSATLFIVILTVLTSMTGVTYGGKPSILLSILFVFVANVPENYFFKKTPATG